ncbi:HNH endonuclease [Okeania sp. SIO2B3]|uniref:HNH endonuclease n=1 Tax=Okeania sp. SIO2B3 TaxID=2607784 RepID=UPI0013BED075|nr:HNH endonuclease [Okeania sp. SIO2B3]NET45513.1 HNH endonuclease [Okeania sp. SIO2B3]
MSSYISESLRVRISESDRHSCCYCLTSEINSGIRMTYDHIYPISKGGKTSFENVCLACQSCNEFKGNIIEVIDPLTGEKVFLFNPRQQEWLHHFQWSYYGTKMEGITAVGRATIIALRTNNPVIVAVRKRWVAFGWHPPLD